MNVTAVLFFISESEKSVRAIWDEIEALKPYVREKLNLPVNKNSFYQSVLSLEAEGLVDSDCEGREKFVWLTQKGFDLVFEIKKILMKNTALNKDLDKIIESIQEDLKDAIAGYLARKLSD